MNKNINFLQNVAFVMQGGAVYKRDGKPIP